MSFWLFCPIFGDFEDRNIQPQQPEFLYPIFLAPIGIFYEFIDEETKKQISNFNLFTNLINYKQKT